MDQIEVTPLQEVVDDLSARLGLPVLLDDRDLQPLAYSSQIGHLDAVRTASILRRGAPQAVREALLRQGIAAAEEPLHLRGDPGLEMEARVCVPIAGAGGRFGYIWIIEEQRLSDEQLLAATEAAARARAILETAAAVAAERAARDDALLRALVHGEGGAEELAARLERARLLRSRPLALCVAALAGSDGDHERAWLRAGLGRFRRRASEGLTLCGEVDGLDVCVAAVHDSALRAGGGEAGELLRAAVEQVAPPPGTAVVVGEGPAFSDLADAPAAFRRARAALRTAQAQAGEPASPDARPGASPARDGGRRSPAPRADASPAPAGGRVVRWDALGVDRLLALLPPHELLADLPPGVAALLAPEHATLRRTLEAYLDRAGDVKATAEALQLHRTGLYHRLHRIEQLAGIDLHSGEDRLLCQLALRVAKLA